MNILLSDIIAKEFAQVGNVADQVGLDSGKASNNQLFWEGVQEAFAVQDETYENMIFMDDEFLNDLYHINLGKVVLHD